jgi:hypothetical protein
MKVIRAGGEHGRGRTILVDDQDYDLVKDYTWSVTIDRNGLWYARRGTSINGRWTDVKMHREIMGLKHGDPRHVDHINHNSTVLDNRRSNLRVCTPSQNQMNRRLIRGSKGVSWHKASQKWQARICHGETLMYLGLYESKRAAALAYDEAARSLDSPFVRINY